MAVGSRVDVGVGSPAIRVASREAANRSASCSASIAVRVAWSSRRRWASMASMTVFVASMSGVGSIVGNGVGVFKTSPGVTSSPKSDLASLMGMRSRWRYQALWAILETTAYYVPELIQHWPAAIARIHGRVSESGHCAWRRRSHRGFRSQFCIGKPMMMTSSPMRHPKPLWAQTRRPSR